LIPSKKGRELIIADLKTQLATLVNLQLFDSQIYRLTEEKEAKPGEIEGLRAAFEEKKKRLEELEKVSLGLQKAKKDAELDLAAKEEAAKKLQSQLYSLKTNKEYNTMLSQIQDAKADASHIEDRILEAMEKIELSRRDIDDEKKLLQEEERNFMELKKKIDDRIKEIEGELAQLKGQRAQLAPAIDPKILAQYDRILANRDGLAIVGVKDNTCGGCNMFVPAQVINLIKMFERIITCEVCNRILYIPDGEP